MSPHDHTSQEIRREIDATRRELGATIEALAAKTAIKARLHDRVSHVKDDLQLPLRAAAIGGTVIALLIAWTQLRRTD